MDIALPGQLIMLLLEGVGAIGYFVPATNTKRPFCPCVRAASRRPANGP